MNTKRTLNTVADVVVIGGGPAGMMAAGQAAKRGLSVVILEKNPELGRKLLITGGGRCNVTNNKTDVRTMLEKYKKSGKFLFSAFSQFAVKEALEFFNGRGMPTKEENEGRVFPVSNSARSVFDVLVDFMKENGVQVRTNATVTNISKEQGTELFRVKLKDGSTLSAKSCILATGGTSHPETGSTGEGFKWLKSLGHTVAENNFALVPIALKDTWAKKLGGVTLSAIKLSVVSDGQTAGDDVSVKKTKPHIGKLLFTHVGISGPMVLNMSREVGEFLQYGDVKLKLDLFPRLDLNGLRATLNTLLADESNKKLKNTLNQLMPSALVLPMLELAKIDGDIPNHSVRSEHRAHLVALLKAIPLHVKGLLGANKAVVSSGGVVLEEIDFRTMESRKVSNLYLIGDVLNIDRPSGGYSLQLCWTTGFVAGTHCNSARSDLAQD